MALLRLLRLQLVIALRGLNIHIVRLPHAAVAFDCLEDEVVYPVSGQYREMSGTNLIINYRTKHRTLGIWSSDLADD